VDSARRFESDLSEAVNLVGARHDLGDDWLNERAAPFWPATASYDECDLVFEHPALTVRRPSPEVIFVMKLYRADPPDRDDLVLLWPLCRFADPGDAAEAFRRAYPHAPDDPEIEDYIAEMAREAIGGRS
jgi:hypothetical protein